MNAGQLSQTLRGSLQIQDIAYETLSKSDRDALKATVGKNPVPMPKEVEDRVDQALAKAREQVESAQAAKEAKDRAEQEAWEKENPWPPVE
jgi:hypothetical protein